MLEFWSIPMLINICFSFFSNHFLLCLRKTEYICNSSTNKKYPYLGFGLGLRKEHYHEVLEENLRIAAAEEAAQVLQHNSRLHYPDAVIEIEQAKTGNRYYVESNGSKVFVIDRSGATRKILNVMTTIDLDTLVGSPVIRHLAIRNNLLIVTIGKHTEVVVDLENDQIREVRAD